MDAAEISSTQVLIIVVMALWSLVWKGIALWKAATNKDKAWFVALLIINTAGILELFYIFVFSKRHSRANVQNSDSSDTA